MKTVNESKNFQGGTMAKPPFAPGKMVDMSRDAPKGMGGSGFALTSNAKYGTDGVGGQDATAMGRSTKKAMGGSGKSSLPPATAVYGTKGVNAPESGSYGTKGVPGGGGQGGKRSQLHAAATAAAAAG